VTGLRLRWGDRAVVSGRRQCCVGDLYRMQSQISTSFLHHGSRANDCLPITVLSIVTAPSVTRPLMTAPSITCQASTVREQMSAHHSPSIKSQGRLSSRCHSPTRKIIGQTHQSNLKAACQAGVTHRTKPSVKYQGHPSGRCHSPTRKIIVQTHQSNIQVTRQASVTQKKM
jgi:hypothetical protein